MIMIEGILGRLTARCLYVLVTFAFVLGASAAHAAGPTNPKHFFWAPGQTATPASLSNDLIVLGHEITETLTDPGAESSAGLIQYGPGSTTRAGRSATSAPGSETACRFPVRPSTWLETTATPMPCRRSGATGVSAHRLLLAGILTVGVGLLGSSPMGR